MNGRELSIVDAESIFYEPIRKPRYLVEGLIPNGLTLLCGSQKVGKSWLVLKLCLCVSKGEDFFGLPTVEGDVLYLCLEDTHSRIQSRLFKLTDEVSERLKFARCCSQLGAGLISELNTHMKNYPDTKLIVIDTLQKIRTATKDSMYASDYEDLSAIKKLADRYSIAAVVVHHVRKQGDNDIFNKVSGTMGITGCADTTIVLEKESRMSDMASLYLVGRDIEYQQLKVRFSDCEWELLERKDRADMEKERIPQALLRVIDFMAERWEWEGTVTELLEEMGDIDIRANELGKFLSQYNEDVLMANGILYRSWRTGAKRTVTLTREERSGFCDNSDNDDNNDKSFGIPP